MNVLKQSALFIRANLWIVPLVALLVWVLFRFLDPAPPREVAMVTGSEGGGYHQFGLALKERLAEDGLTLNLYPTRGSLDNLARLTADYPDVQLGLIQSGTTRLLERAELKKLEGLAALYHEPLWLFQRKGDGDREDEDEEIRRLSDLYGKRVAVGSEGSGTYAVVRSLFEARGDASRFEGLDHGNWIMMPGEAAADALQNGNLDAAFFVLPADNDRIARLLSDPQLQLVSLAQARAYAARLTFLNHLTVTEGLLDIAGNVPRQDVELLSPVATLIANQSFHPALTSLVLEAARDVLSEGNLLDPAGDFPAAKPVELPLTGEADYYHRQGVPFLQRYLPFWIASIVDRYVVLLIPFIAIMVPLLRSMGPIYSWRMRARVFRWYAQLRDVDKLIHRGRIQDELEEQIERLHKLQEELTHVDVPLSYAHELYSLHLHVRYMINRLESMRAGAQDSGEDVALE
ncbi:TAXI family TRAP transporter solute-binding subunit [Halopseudomonas sp.]|uniref:TAXI family TRAP transporter solute-binding subunit n=1 Tax=Halopseudomonas sp. TaxID=2901191 RepID=UPI00356ACE87